MKGKVFDNAAVLRFLFAKINSTCVLYFPPHSDALPMSFSEQPHRKTQCLLAHISSTEILCFSNTTLSGGKSVHLTGWTLLLYSVHPILPKREKICVRTLGSDPLVPKSLSVGKSMRCACKTTPPRGEFHICTTRHSFSHLRFFSALSDEIGRHKCATFYAPSTNLHTQITTGYSRERWCWPYFTLLRNINTDKSGPQSSSNVVWIHYWSDPKLQSINKHPRLEWNIKLSDTCSVETPLHHCSAICCAAHFCFASQTLQPSSTLAVAWYCTVYEFFSPPSSFLRHAENQAMHI